MRFILTFIRRDVFVLVSVILLTAVTCICFPKKAFNFKARRVAPCTASTVFVTLNDEEYALITSRARTSWQMRTTVRSMQGGYFKDVFALEEVEYTPPAPLETPSAHAPAYPLTNLSTKVLTADELLPPSFAAENVMELPAPPKVKRDAFDLSVLPDNF